MTSTVLPLKAFKSELNQKFELLSHLKLYENKKEYFFELQFELIDPDFEFEKELSHSPSFRADRNLVLRADEVWKKNCFEIFLKPLNQSSYYEFNFGLSPIWNCYRFLNYRNPQPPEISHDFVLIQAEWNLQLKKFNVLIQNKSFYQSFEIGITAILKKSSHENIYFALTHAGSKPDFHLHESFILKRSWE